jgi:uncharacterized protein YukE
MRHPKPPDFEPLASSDPVPGDPDGIARLGRRYADTAAEISRQAANLRKLASAAPDGWVGKAGSTFHQHAADLATRITSAHDRYATTGTALQGAAGPMDAAQQEVYGAVWQAKAAEAAMTANAPAPPPAAGSPPPTAAQKAAAPTRAGNYSAAKSSSQTASTAFHNGVTAYHKAAGHAAGQISGAISHDAVHDSWWDRNFGWISTVFKVIAIVVLVLAVVALLLACPALAAALAEVFAAMGMTAEAAAAAVAAISTVAEWGAAILTGTQAIFDGIAAGTGKESWTAFALDIAGLVTFGFGTGATAIIRGLAEGAGQAGEAVAAGRAGRAAMPSLLGFAYSLASRSTTAEGLVRVLGLGGRFDGAVQAADGARSAVSAAVKAAEPQNLPALFTMSKDIAEGLARLNTLSEQVPNVLRIEVPSAAASGLATAVGGLQWSTFAATHIYTVHSIFASGFAGGGGDTAAISQDIGQFRAALAHVP